MPFGFAAGLPMRCSEDPELGVSAAQHCRLTEHLVSIANTSPLFTGVVRWTSTGDLGFVSYAGKNGTGLMHAPAVIVGPYALGFNVQLAAYTNNLGFAVDFRRWIDNGVALEVVRLDTGTGAGLFNPITMELEVSAVIEHDYLVTAYAAEPLHIGAFDGHVDKQNCKTEGDSTYTYEWYKILRAAQGTAFSTSDSSVRAWETMSQARALGTFNRLTEMFSASSTPGGSDLLLDRWATLLGVQKTLLPKWIIREQCEENFIGLNPATFDSMSAELANRLGLFFAFLDANTHSGITKTMAWQTGVYWPEVYPGPNDLNLDGNGCRSSSRARFNLVLNQGSRTADEVLAESARLADGYLRRVAPATSTWEPCTTVGGFTIGTSQIGLAAI